MKQEALTSIQSVSQSSSRNRTTVCVHFRMERSIIATCLRHRTSVPRKRQKFLSVAAMPPHLSIVDLNVVFLSAERGAGSVDNGTPGSKSWEAPSDTSHSGRYHCNLSYSDNIENLMEDYPKK